MLEKSYLHQNGVELNFLFIGSASRPAISLRINPRIREDSKGVAPTTAAPTTSAPTTAASTSLPTTAAPKTVAPTTDAAKTAALAIGAPTTSATTIATPITAARIYKPAPVVNKLGPLVFTYRPAKYEYEYAVRDDDTNNLFGAKESRDGKLTNGEYYVSLPDGRLQTVTYFVDKESNYLQ